MTANAKGALTRFALHFEFCPATPVGAIGKPPLDGSVMLWVRTMTNVPFPFTSLTAKQTVIVSELLRDHPQGRIESDEGRPVFITNEGASAIRIPLSDGPSIIELPKPRPQ